MRNGRFVLPVGDEGTLNLYVTQLGNVQPPRVCFETIPLASIPIFAAIQAGLVLPSYASA